MKPRAPPPLKEEPFRFVAVHKSVLDFMREFMSYTHVQKWCALSDDLLEGDEEIIRMTLRRLDTETLRDGLLEVGPKRRRGGSPRLFILRDKSGCFFLLAAMEKSNHGVKGMDTAVDRAKTVRSMTSRPNTSDNTWSDTYVLLSKGESLEKRISEPLA